jgi:hypothetical protein
MPVMMEKDLQNTLLLLVLLLEKSDMVIYLLMTLFLLLLLYRNWSIHLHQLSPFFLFFSPFFTQE